jgi:diketogulonate reductase-like aldo/keto reductase
MESQSTNLTEPIKLSNGQLIPRLGVGSFLMEDAETVIYQSIKDGVRLIDTAWRYSNEKQVGNAITRAINEGLVKREDLFIVTKVWVGHKTDPEKALKGQLVDLNLDYVDLYLDHWPMTVYEWEGVSYKAPTYHFWCNMEKLVEQGLTKSIGLCNYNVQHILDILSFCKIRPVVNQIEYHPYLMQNNLIKFCKNEGITIMAFNSLVRGKYVDRFHKESNLSLVEEPIVKEIAEKHNTTPGLIALNFPLSQGHVTIYGTSNPNRTKENLNALKINLSEEDQNAIAKLDRGYRFNTSVQWDFFKGVDVFA